MEHGIVFEWQYGCYTGIDKISVHINHYCVKDYLDSLSFWIFEGNFCCDCNRRLVIKDYVWDSSGCSEDIIINHAKFYKDGKYIGWGCDWDWYMIGDDYDYYLGKEVPF